MVVNGVWVPIDILVTVLIVLVGSGYMETVERNIGRVWCIAGCLPLMYTGSIAIVIDAIEREIEVRNYLSRIAAHTDMVSTWHYIQYHVMFLQDDSIC